MHTAMANQQVIDRGNRMMDKTDQAIGGQNRLDYLSYDHFVRKLVLFILES